MEISHSKPTLGQEEIIAISKVIKSGHIGQGPQVQKFEEYVADYIGVNNAVAVNSGTSALHLGLLSLGVGKGDEVILPSYVCSSPYLAIKQTGATPIICDIEKETLLLSKDSLESAITNKTKAVIVPHLFGNVCNVKTLSKFDIPIVEDCAQSLGSELSSKKAGSFGNISIFSFYATKMITTGEGGMILSNDEKIIDSIKDMRDYDKKKLDKLRYNYKMTDIQAAIGISQLSHINEFIKRRKKIADEYNIFFKDMKINSLKIEEEVKSVYYRYIIFIEENTKIIQELKKIGIFCEKPIWKPLHKLERQLNKLKNTDTAFNSAISVPIYPSLTDDQINYIKDNLKKILDINYN